MEIRGRSITVEGAENVWRLVEALVGGDVEAAVDLCDTGVEVEESPRWPDRRTYRGREGARQAYETMLEAFEDVRFEIESLIEIGDQVVVHLNVFGRGRESGVETNARIGHLYTLEGEKIMRLRVYDDRDEAEQVARDEAR